MTMGLIRNKTYIGRLDVGRGRLLAVLACEDRVAVLFNKA